jgi:hypothetical protein
MRATITVRRNDEDLTVVISFGNRSSDRVVTAIDENGDRVRLTSEERLRAIELARLGIDETGR